MFWESVVAGLKVLTYWQAYVAAAEYLIIWIVPAGILLWTAERTGAIEGGVGCITMLLSSVLQVFAVAVFTLTLAPIILGISENAAWALPWALLVSNPGPFVKFVGILLLSGIVLAFIPFFGQLPSLQTLVLGALTLILSVGLLEKIGMTAGFEALNLMPSFWFIVGILLISGALASLGSLVLALAHVAVERYQETDSRASTVNEMLLLPTVSVLGFIPVFIYGAWLGSQLLPADMSADRWSPEIKALYVDRCTDSLFSQGLSRDQGKPYCSCITDGMEKEFGMNEHREMLKARPNPNGNPYDQRLYQVVKACELHLRK